MREVTLKMKNKISDHTLRTKVLSLASCLIIFFSLLPGCTIWSKLSGQPGQQQEQTDEVPKQMEKLETAIEDIFLALNGPSLGSEKKEDNGEANKGQKLDQGQENQGQDQQKTQQQDGQQQKTQQGQQGQQANQQTKNPWQEVDQAVKELHLNWNEYMPEITKKGGSKELLDGFSNALNNLTKIAESKERAGTLLGANQVYGHISGIYSLYKTKEPPELKRISYYTRNTVLDSLTGDWSKAQSDLEEVKNRWSLVKNSINQDQQEDSAKLDLSIYELEKVVKQNNKELAEIKGSITLMNIQDLEKAIAKK